MGAGAGQRVVEELGVGGACRAARRPLRATGAPLPKCAAAAPCTRQKLLEVRDVLWPQVQRLS